jgi:hypothetical protein
MNIPYENTDEIKAALQAVVGKRKHLYTHTYLDIFADTEEALDRLRPHVPKGLLVGTEIYLSSKPKLPVSYGNHQVVYTHIEILVHQSGLVVTSIKKRSAPVSTRESRVRVVLPAPVADFLKNRLLHNLTHIE